MEYTVDYFIRKFENIREEYFIIGDFGKDGKHCAYGHCGMNWHKAFSEVPEASALGNLFDGNDLVAINDGHHKKYPQPTPKQRILAALYDLKIKDSESTCSSKPQHQFAEVTFTKIKEQMNVPQSVN